MTVTAMPPPAFSSTWATIHSACRLVSLSPTEGTSRDPAVISASPSGNRMMRTSWDTRFTPLLSLRAARSGHVDGRDRRICAATRNSLRLAYSDARRGDTCAWTGMRLRRGRIDSSSAPHLLGVGGSHVSMRQLEVGDKLAFRVCEGSGDA